MNTISQETMEAAREIILALGSGSGLSSVRAGGDQNSVAIAAALMREGMHNQRAMRADLFNGRYRVIMRIRSAYPSMESELAAEGAAMFILMNGGLDESDMPEGVTYAPGDLTGGYETLLSYVSERRASASAKELERWDKAAMALGDEYAAYAPLSLVA